MTNALKTGTLLCAFFAAMGCVPTRSPQLLSLERPGDKDLNCENIAIDYKTNTEVAANKIAKNRSGDTSRGFSAGNLWLMQPQVQPLFFL